MRSEQGSLLALNVRRHPRGQSLDEGGPAGKMLVTDPSRHLLPGPCGRVSECLQEGMKSRKAGPSSVLCALNDEIPYEVSSGAWSAAMQNWLPEPVQRVLERVEMELVLMGGPLWRFASKVAVACHSRRFRHL